MFGKVYICTGRSKRPRCLTVVVVKCGINSFWKIKNCPSPKKANNDINSESRTNKNSSRERIWEALRRLLHLSAAGMQFFVFMHRSITDVATGNRFNIWGESYLLGTWRVKSDFDVDLEGCSDMTYLRWVAQSSVSCLNLCHWLWRTFFRTNLVLGRKDRKGRKEKCHFPLLIHTYMWLRCNCTLVRWVAQCITYLLAQS